LPGNEGERSLTTGHGANQCFRSSAMNRTWLAASSRKHGTRRCSSQASYCQIWQLGSSGEQDARRPVADPGPARWRCQGRDGLASRRHAEDQLVDCARGIMSHRQAARRTSRRTARE
jgi:hypothetical protein